MKLNIAITTGEPAGIGVEISLKAAVNYIHHSNINLVLLGDKSLLEQTASKCNIKYDEFSRINIEHIPLIAPNIIGKLNANNSRYVLDILDAAIEGCLNKTYHAMVTAPIHKGIINQAGINFSGHTEYLALKTNTKRVIMLLSGMDSFRNKRLRVALATTHIALDCVTDNISEKSIYNDILTINHYLKYYFSITSPLIKAAGINPHAGEGGYIGKNEQNTLIPAINKLKQLGIHVEGPLAGDTLFLQHADCFYCMYHDQGLAPFKYATFGKGVNITLGLPIIRTSVDHGTALDIASCYKADCDSMHEAIQEAIKIIHNTNKL